MPDLFITIPHSGRQIPPEAVWLKSLPDSVLFCDVDAFVDELYELAAKQQGLTAVIFPWHRYAVDVNRLPEDHSSRTVEGAASYLGRGVSSEVHWHQTTKGDLLIKKPLSKKQHQQLIDKYYHPFHHKIQEEFKKRKAQGRGGGYHLDLHSMPSLGRTFHRDPGQKRAQIVIGNREGRSADNKFSELVLSSYKTAGFEVVLNWPYHGGRITELYGRPEEGQHTLQVEISRALYMEENTGQKSPHFSSIQKQLKQAFSLVGEGLRKFG